MSARSEVKEGLGELVNFSVGFIDGHLRIPTFMKRYVDDSEKDFVKKDFFYKIGGIVPAVGHLMFGAYPLGAYHFLFNYDAKIATTTLITQITTNAMSGFYELYRYHKDINSQNKEKGIRIESSDLEKEIKIEESKRDFVNPWEVDFPKLGEKEK